MTDAAMTRSPEIRTRRGRKLPRRVTGVFGWLVVAAVVWALVPFQWGGHLGLTVVAGESMEPTYHTGDLVLSWRRDTYAVGDVVVYTVPEGEPGEGYNVVHRITARGAEGYTLRGDNNERDDMWTPSDDDVRGEVFAVVPSGGRWLRLIVSPLVMAFLAGVLVAVAVAMGGKRGDQEDGPEGPGSGSGSGPGRLAAAAVGVVTLLGTSAGNGSAATLGGVRTADLYAHDAPSSITGQVTYSQTMTSDLGLTYCASVRVTNGTNATVTWQVAIDLSAAPFNANLITTVVGATTVSHVGDTWTVKGGVTNQTLAPGANTTFTYCGTR